MFLQRQLKYFNKRKGETYVLWLLFL